MLWLSFVTYLGNLISPYVRLACASSEPRLYGVAIGKSARTRKSAGNNAARDVFKEVGKSQRIIEGFGSAEGLLSTLGTQKTTGSPKPTIVHFDEINVLASKTEIKGSAGIAAFNKLFEDHTYHHPLARGDGYFVENAYLSLIGASTLEDFTKTWSAKHEDAGLFSRLLIVGADVNEKRIPWPKDADSKALNSLVEEIRGLFDSVALRPRTFSLNLDADAVWSTFYDSFGDGPEWGRIDTYGSRLLALQAAIRGEETITKENVQDIVEFLQYEVAVRQCVSPVIADNPQAQMEELVRRALPVGTTMSRRDLQRKTNYSRLGTTVFERAIGGMIVNGELLRRAMGKTILYSRLDNDETESQADTGLSDASSPSAGISDVITATEDSGDVHNVSCISTLEENDSEGHQISVSACVHEEKVA